MVGLDVIIIGWMVTETMTKTTTTYHIPQTQPQPQRSHTDAHTQRRRKQQTKVRNTRIVVIISRPGLRNVYAPAGQFHLTADILEALHDAPLEVLVEIV